MGMVRIEAATAIKAWAWGIGMLRTAEVAATTYSATGGEANGNSRPL